MGLVTLGYPPLRSHTEAARCLWIKHDYKGRRGNCLHWALSWNCQSEHIDGHLEQVYTGMFLGPLCVGLQGLLERKNRDHWRDWSWGLLMPTQGEVYWSHEVPPVVRLAQSRPPVRCSILASFGGASGETLWTSVYFGICCLFYQRLPPFIITLELWGFPYLLDLVSTGS